MDLGDCFPNLVLMKISAFHKKQGDRVGWYNPWDGFLERYDRVYMSKVFSFTPDYDSPVYADEIFRGGSGYSIQLTDGKEVYTTDRPLPYEIEHIYPDYSLYGIEDTAHGFMSRGCPRGCDFCHVKAKEGTTSYKVADLSEFWQGQKNICLYDPNTLACRDWKDILTQLKDSKALVDFNQGLDIRMMTPSKAEMLEQIRIKAIHFAWDRWGDKDQIIPRFEQFRKVSTVHPHNLQVYVLCNFNTTHEQDLYRVMWLKDNGYAPYVMIYNKQSLPKGHITRKLQRYVNMRSVFWSCEWEGYQKYSGEEL